MRQWLIDAFASRPFKGNQACVVEPLAGWPSDDWMQALAAENNVGATAFLLRSEDPARFGLRWFTPATEVPLCGHATLAAAHMLFDELGSPSEQLRFDTVSGALTVRREAEAYEMALPAIAPRRIATPEGLAEALGAEPVAVWVGNYLVALLDSPAAVFALAPDHERLQAISRALGGLGNVGVAALAEGARGVDVIDRFFAPGFGIAEDPATGSFHALLMPILAERLGVQALNFHQAFPGRGADLGARLDGDRVLLRGAAVTVAEAVLRRAARPPAAELAPASGLAAVSA
jgi:PhzF family phenazine biosynthesis protein